MRWLKRAAWIAILAALTVFGGFRIRQAYVAASAAKAPRGGPGGGLRVVSVGTAQARTGSVRGEILITGALKPKEQVDVSPKATGRVEKLYFYIGDPVKAGDLIAELEDDELQQQVKRATASQAVARASMRQRQAELSNAKAELARAKNLLADGLISNQDFEARQTSYQVVQAQVQLSQAQVDEALAQLSELQIRLEQSKIHAPMSGYVSRRHVDVGALVNPSTPIISLVNLSVMVTAANVPEREVGKMRVGSRARVQVDAFGPHVFEGRVARISPVLDAATRSAVVEVEIPNPNAGLKAEMFARVTLDLGTTREAVLIPREALVYRGTQPGVYLLEVNRPVFRNIETGMAEGDDVEVTGNLDAGTTIITRGASMLTEGDQIRIAGEGGPGRKKGGDGDGAPGGRPPERKQGRN